MKRNVTLLALATFCSLFLGLFNVHIVQASEVPVTNNQFYLENLSEKSTVELDGNYYFCSYEGYDITGVTKYDGHTYQSILPEDIPLSDYYTALLLSTNKDELILGTLIDNTYYIYTYDGQDWAHTAQVDVPYKYTSGQPFSLDGNSPAFLAKDFDTNNTYIVYNNGYGWTLSEENAGKYQLQNVNYYTDIPRELGNVSEILYKWYDGDEYILNFVNGAIYSSKDLIHWFYKGERDYQSLSILGSDYFLKSEAKGQPYVLARSTNTYDWEVIDDFIDEVPATYDEIVYPFRYKYEDRHYISDNRYFPTYYSLHFAQIYYTNGAYNIIFKYGNDFADYYDINVARSTDLDNWTLVEGIDMDTRYTYNGNPNISTHYNEPFLLDNGLFYTTGSYGFFATSTNLINWTVHPNMRTASLSNGDYISYTDCFLVDGTYYLQTVVGDKVAVVTTKDFISYNKTVLDLPAGGDLFESYGGYYYRTEDHFYRSTDFFNWETYVSDAQVSFFTKDIYLETNEHLEFHRFYDFTDILVSYNYDLLDLEAAPIAQNGTTLVPIRDVAESFGFEVIWEGFDQSITLKNDSQVIKMYLDDTNVSVNGQSKTFSLAPTVFNQKTYVPIRFISETIGKTVTWDGHNQLISITD